MGKKPAPVQAIESVLSSNNGWRPVVTPFGEPQSTPTKRKKAPVITEKQRNMQADTILNDRLG